MDFTFRQLDIFLKCAEKLHFTNAAKALHMTPAAISKQITNLEQHLKTKLFEVIGKKVTLTSSGCRLLPYVKSIKKEVDCLKEIVSTDFLTQAQPLRLSFTPGLQNIIFKSIQSFNASYPEVLVEVTIHNKRAQQRDDLLKDRIDAYFSSKHLKDKRIIQNKVFSLLFYIVCPKHRKFNNNIKQETFITPTAEKESAKGYNKILCLDTYVSVKEAILANLGIGLLPSNLIEGDSRLKIINSAPSLIKPIYLSYRKTHKHPELDLFSSYLSS